MTIKIKRSYLGRVAVFGLISEWEEVTGKSFSSIDIRTSENNGRRNPG